MSTLEKIKQLMILLRSDSVNGKETVNITIRLDKLLSQISPEERKEAFDYMMSIEPQKINKTQIMDYSQFRKKIPQPEIKTKQSPFLGIERRHKPKY